MFVTGLTAQYGTLIATSFGDDHTLKIWHQTFCSQDITWKDLARVLRHVIENAEPINAINLGNIMQWAKPKHINAQMYKPFQKSLPKPRNPEVARKHIAEMRRILRGDA